MVFKKVGRIWLLISETRGVEYASSKKSNCIKEMIRLKKDDRENGGYIDNYHIEEDNTGFYKEGVQNG